MSRLWEKLILKGSHVPEIESGSELASGRASDKNDAPPSLPLSLVTRAGKGGGGKFTEWTSSARALLVLWGTNDCESSQFAAQRVDRTGPPPTLLFFA